MASGWLFASILLITQLIMIISCDVINKVPFTYVADAIPKRAVCEDGTPAGYFHAVGFGEGADNWIIYMMGGGWCEDNYSCQNRRNGPYGSTNNVKPKSFYGILSSDQSINPDFYNWNIVFIYYCDGSSFLGDIDITDLGPNDLQLRGSRIFYSIIDELLAKGMKTAKNVLLGGRSAGAVAAIMHCDNFGALLPNAHRLKCFSDSGLFIRGNNVPNDADSMERVFNSTIHFHNLNSYLPKSCTSKMNPSLTPLFLLNTAFDFARISAYMKPQNSDDLKGWQNCTNNLAKCTNVQRQLITDYGKTFLKTLMNIDDKPSRGLYINACYTHVFSESNELWSSSGSHSIGNMTISQAVGDWFFDRKSIKLIDTQTDFPYNCPS